jgi:hypothetical protein
LNTGEIFTNFLSRLYMHTSLPLCHTHGPFFSKNPYQDCAHAVTPRVSRDPSISSLILSLSLNKKL